MLDDHEAAVLTQLERPFVQFEIMAFASNFDIEKHFFIMGTISVYKFYKQNFGLISINQSYGKEINSLSDVI